jgi:hypothetical protein
MNRTPPPLPPIPETFALLRGFFILVSLYNVFNLTAIFAFMEHQLLAVLGLVSSLGPTAQPLALVTFVAMIVQSVYLCRFNNTSRRVQTILSAIAPFTRLWGILAIRTIHPERITSTIWVMIGIAATFDLFVVFAANSKKAQRATQRRSALAL